MNESKAMLSALREDWMELGQNQRATREKDIRLAAAVETAEALTRIADALEQIEEVAE